MKRWVVVVRLLLPVLMVGCAPRPDLHAVRAHTVALEQQRSAQHQTMEGQVQQLSDRVAELEQAQAATRRDMARAATTADALRSQVQRSQGAMQKIRRRVPRGPTEKGTATRLTNVETRLRALQQQLRVAS